MRYNYRSNKNKDLCLLFTCLGRDTILICREHTERAGSPVMSTYGEGKINESWETWLVTSYCLRLSPSGSMGLIGLWRGGQASSLPFSALGTQWDLAVWHQLLYQSMNHTLSLSLHYYSEGGHTSGITANAFFCSISWKLGDFFCSVDTGRERERERVWELHFNAGKAVIWCDWQVGSRQSVDSPSSPVESESKERQIPSHLCILFSTGVDPHGSWADCTSLHKFEI